MAAESVGQIGLDLVVNKNEFEKQMSGIQSLAKKAAAALAGAFAIKKIVDFGKECLELGSDLAEVQNVVDVTFPSMTAQVDEFAKSAINGFGLSETMAKQFTGTFGAMAKAFGFTEQQAYDMGSTLTGLAGDVASFYNISQEEAYTKLKSVFSGETETLKDLGVVMTQSALDAYAMANGFGKTTSAMTEAEKVALRYQFVQDKLAAAQGDFARTSGSWANQVRILNLQFDSLKATIGQGLINLFTPIIRGVNTLLGKLGTLANAFKAFTELITGNKSSGSSGEQIASMGAAATDAGTGLESATDAADSMASSAKNAGTAAKKAAAEIRSLMGFDQINKLTDNSSDSDSGDSGSGSGTSADGIGSAINFGSLAQGETIIEQVDGKFTKMFENIKKLCEPAIQSLKRLYNEGLAQLGKFVWTALEDFYKGFLVPVGKWTLGTGIPRFVDALNNGLMKVNWTKINASLKSLWDALAPFAINVGEGLLWFWEKVLVPLGTWTANEVVPRFLVTLRIGIENFNNILIALQPLFQWFWSSVLQPIAQWTGGVFLTIWDGINKALQKFSDWCGKNPSTIQGVTITIGSFFAAWKATELLSFIEQSGGVVAALKRIATALLGTTVAKITDKMETLYLTALYAKDFVVSIAQGTAALLAQAKQWAFNTAAKYADEAAMAGVSVAEVAWQSLMSTSIAQMALRAAAWIKETALKVADTAAQLAMTAATVAWNAVCAIATAATTAFGAAVAFLTSPIGIAIAAIGALIAAGVLLYKNWDVVKEKCTKLKEWVIKKTTELKDGAVKAFETLRDNVSNAMQVLFTCVREKWTEIKQKFQSFDTWLAGVFQKDWTESFGVFGNVLNDFSRNAAIIWDGIKGVFNGIITFIKGVFSGDWEQAWSGVATIFANIFGSLEGIAKTPINGVISMVNSLISKLNSAVRAVENAFSFSYDFTNPITGTRHYGNYGLDLPSIPTVPMLAQGAFVEKNTPRLAMIGDNRHYGEIVAPEDKMMEMAMAAAQAVGGTSPETLALLKQILELLKKIDPVTIDEEALRKYFIKKTNQNTKSRGTCELVT